MASTTPPTPEIVAAAIRCSTDAQEDSPEVQRSIVDAFCKSNGYVVPADLWFVDFAVSAEKAVEKRPAGSRMLKMVMDHKHRPFTKIIIVRLDRFFRDSKEQAVTWDLIAKHGCELVGAKQDLSRDTAMKRAMLTITGAVNQLEREVTGERIKEHNTWRHGKGMIPHGYPSLGLLRTPKDDENPLRIDPVGLATAIRVFELYLETGGNYRKIVRQLNSEGLRSRRGKRWCATSVYGILGGPNYRRKTYYDGELVDTPNLIPVSIPPPLLARVDAMLTARYGTWHIRQKSDKRRICGTSIYSALLQCVRCGSSLDFRPPAEIIRSTLKLSGEPSVERKMGTFACRSMSQQTRRDITYCGLPVVHAPTLDWMVGHALKAALEARAGVVAATDQPKQKAPPVPKDIHAMIASIEDRRQRAFSAYVDGHASVEYYKREKERLDLEEATLRRATSPVSTVTATPLMDYRAAAAVLEDWDELWKTVDWYSAAKREFLMGVLGLGRGSIIVDKVPHESKRRQDRWKVVIHSPVLGKIEYSYTGVAKGDWSKKARTGLDSS